MSLNSLPRHAVLTGQLVEQFNSLLGFIHLNIITFFFSDRWSYWRNILHLAIRLAEKWHASKVGASTLDQLILQRYWG